MMISKWQKVQPVPKRTWSVFLVLLLGIIIIFAGTAVAQEGNEPEGPFPMEHPDFPGVTILDYERTPAGVNATIQIPVAEDAYIASGDPYTNFGSSSTLTIGYAGGNGQNASRLLIKFNLGAIPTNAHVTNATFNMYQLQVTPSNDADHCFRADFPEANWSEGTVTWANASNLGGSEIGVGCYDNAIGWKAINATQVINYWHSGNINYGAYLTGDESPTSNRSRYFYSKEQSVNFCGGPYQCSPYLIVEYSTQCDTLPPTATVNALPQWRPQSFTVTWSGTDQAPSGCAPSGIANYSVQYRLNGGNWVDWQSFVTETSAQFSSAGNGQFVEFRVRARDNAGNVTPWDQIPTQASTTVDTVNPTATVNPLPQYSQPYGTITWGGSDNLSGIATYSVQYRVNGGSWQLLINNTTQTSYNYTGAPAGFYEFRARATDNANNTSPWPENPQASTTIVTEPSSYISVSPNIIKPTDTVTETFTIEWDAFAVAPASVQRIRLYYKHGNSDWIEFFTTTGPAAASGSTTFNWTTASPGGNDGIYYFTSVATDTNAQQESLGDPKGSGIVDMADAVNPAAYLPVIMQESGGAFILADPE